jgi:membrane complex biogenesis BtpA family protein
MRQHEWGGLNAAFWAARPLIGMVHLSPLPGSARSAGGDMEPILHQAIADARALAAGGASALMIENFFDAPFAKDHVPPHTVAALTRAVLAVRGAVTLPVGVNCLRNDAIAAIAIAHVCGAQFVRINVFVGAAVTDQGLIEGAAREAVLYRKSLAADVAIWADVMVKHAAQLGTQSIEEAARDAVERGLADALICSGAATGSPTDTEDVRRIRQAVPEVPLLVGSGFTAENAAELLQFASGAVAGTSLKRDGKVEHAVDPARVRELRSAMDAPL